MRHAEGTATRRDRHHTMAYDQGISSMWLRICCGATVCRTPGVVSTGPKGPEVLRVGRAEKPGGTHRRLGPGRPQVLSPSVRSVLGEDKCSPVRSFDVNFR